jgi:hypothetical protein
MVVQWLLVAALVAACFVYAAWTLLPAAARQGIARFSLRLPLPSALASFMRKHSVAESGCGCDGCDRSPVRAAPSAAQTISFHPRLRR